MVTRSRGSTGHPLPTIPNRACVLAPLSQTSWVQLGSKIPQPQGQH